MCIDLDLKWGGKKVRIIIIIIIWSIKKHSLLCRIIQNEFVLRYN